MHQIFISGTNDQQRAPGGGCQTSSPLSQILTYYKRIGFKVGDRLILRASGQTQLYFFGQLGQDNIRLWETTFHEERDGLKVYRAIYEIENPVNRLRELGKTHDIHSYPNHLAPYQEGEFLLGRSKSSACTPC